MRFHSLSEFFRWPRAQHRGLLSAVSVCEEPLRYAGPVGRPLHREPDRPPVIMFGDFLPKV